MPTYRPYTLTPGQRIEIEVVQPDGARALVVGTLDSIPTAAAGQALQLRVVGARVQTLPAEG